MDPITLLTVGPSILRMIGGLFGGKTEEVAHKVADIADSVKGLPGEQAKQQFASKVQSMPPEAMIEIKKIANEAARLETEREAARLQADTKQFSESQQTIRAELATGDQYAIRTRPMMARKSFYAGTFYVLLFELLKVVPLLWGGDSIDDGADRAIAGILYGPAVYYMTMRTIDSFSKKGRT